MNKREQLEKAVVDTAAAGAAYDAAYDAYDAYAAWVKARLELSKYLKEQSGGDVIMSEIGYWITLTCLVALAALNLFIWGFIFMGYM
tara:strand:- start:221 stop:481 length:261 start_codon:yes stop_codon:yes gene_type:complete